MTCKLLVTIFESWVKAGGVSEAQAKAEAEALVTVFSETMDSQLATNTILIVWSVRF